MSEKWSGPCNPLDDIRRAAKEVRENVGYLPLVCDFYGKPIDMDHDCDGFRRLRGKVGEVHQKEVPDGD